MLLYSEVEEFQLRLLYVHLPMLLEHTIGYSSLYLGLSLYFGKSMVGIKSKDSFGSTFKLKYML